MTSRWQVTHTFSETLPVAKSLAGYSFLDVMFVYAPSGSLEKLVHQVDVDDHAIEDHARAASHRQLRQLLDLLEYLSGRPLPVAAIHAFRIHPPQSGMRVSVSGTGTIGVAFEVTRPIAFPPEPSLATADPRLGAWLYLANRAKNAPDEQAIRDYAIIVEEAKASGSLAQQVLYIRHFVSHPQLKNPLPVAFINAELNLSTAVTCPHYDPRQPQQRALLLKWRPIAMRVAHAEIDRLLR